MRGRHARIERLAIAGFRNLASFEFLPGPRFNVVHGENGSGKSNLLEALHYVCALKSFRGARTEDLLRRGGAPVAELAARVAGEPLPDELRVELREGVARRLRLEGKRPRSAAVWRAVAPIVVFHAGHLELSSGAAQVRRAFLDDALDLTDPVYANALAAYGRALRSRNRLLKNQEPDRRAVQAFDGVLAESGSVLGVTRARFVEGLAPIAQAIFTEVSGEAFPLSIRYVPRVEPSEGAIRRALETSFEKDRARGFTAEGPHADEVGLLVNDRGTTRHFASQGQHRAIALALKVAELDLLTQYTGKVPILLLDDVSSELDRARNRRFFDVLARQGGQVFLTTTHPEYIQLEADRHDVGMTQGSLEARPQMSR